MIRLPCMVQASHLQPGAITGIAVHGTGTPLGDPIGVHDAFNNTPKPETPQEGFGIRGKRCVTLLPCILQRWAPLEAHLAHRRKQRGSSRWCP